MPPQTCNLKSKPQFAFIDKIPIDVNVYTRNKGQTKCKNGHDLVYVNGSKTKKPHFRHKNNSDCFTGHMSDWHIDWQDKFCHTEVDFRHKHQHKPRRVDALTPDKTMNIEFQHSNIGQSEVCCRKHDYELNGLKTLWIIDGCDMVVHRTQDGTKQLDFPGGTDWKYSSFTDYEYILIDIEGDIYRVPPSNVSNRMVCVRESHPVAKIIECLNTNPSQIWSLWCDNDYVKPVLRISQQGAGNGKTYGIWRDIAMNESVDVEFIITKQHTAKEVIYSELIDQRLRNEPHIVSSGFQYIGGDSCEKDNSLERHRRQYVIGEYKNCQTGRECIIIIGTIDSLMFSLTPNKMDAGDFFEGILKSLIEHGPDKMNCTTGRFKYGGKSIVLNRRARVWIDEAQDLQTRYLDAVVRLMLDSGINVVLVGDKLQSLGFENNCMTETSHINNDCIDVVFDPPFNINRRIEVCGMAEKINKLVDFNKFGIPEISLQGESELLDSKDTFEIIEVEKQTVSEKNKKTEEYVDLIMSKVEHEVDKHDYKPKDFLFMFVIMESNHIAIELETRLCEFWTNRMGENDDKYTKHAVLHKHQEGQSIDTSQSIDASRIMSIVAAKGDGRPVAFVLGMTENSLRKCSNKEIGLVYESHIHVALTRAKRKTYFALERNNDDIQYRLNNAGHILCFPLIGINLNKQQDITLDMERFIALLRENGVEDFTEVPRKKTTEDPIEWGVHCLKMAVYIQTAVNVIVSKASGKSNWETSQLKQVLNTLSNLNVKSFKPSLYFKELRDFQEEKNKDYKFNIPLFPICKLSKKSYANYHTIIEETLVNNIQLLRNDPKSALSNLGVYESVVMHFSIDVLQRLKYHDMSVMELYDITDSFFSKSNNKEKTLLNEVRQISKIIENALSEVLLRDDVLWNIEHLVKYHGGTEDFTLRYRPSIIGYSSDRIYHLIFVSERNQLNHWEIMKRIALERQVLRNPYGDVTLKKNNKTRYEGKEINTYLFDLRNERCDHIDWKWDDKSSEFTRELTKLVRDTIYTNYSSHGGQIYDWCCDKINQWKTCCQSGGNPFDEIVKDKEIFNTPSFVTKYLDTLRSNSKNTETKGFVKCLMKDRNKFIVNFNKHIKDVVDMYFRVPIEEIYDDTW
jgi:hypothetical protein